MWCRTFKDASSRHEDIDIVLIRENTEGEYSSLEHEVTTYFSIHLLDCDILFDF